MFVCVLRECLVPVKVKDGVRSLDTATDGCELTHGAWEPILGLPLARLAESASSRVSKDLESRVTVEDN